MGTTVDNSKVIMDVENLTELNSGERKKTFTREDSLKCFVIMPFGTRSEYDKGAKESDYIFKHIISPALLEFARTINTQIEIIREVDKTTAGSITKSILYNIARADICIVDTTGLNANVFFELGIRYTLRNKVTILLKQQHTVLPFDISGVRCISYDCFAPDDAVSEIGDFLKTGYMDSRNVDSLVFETFPNMKVEISGLVLSTGEDLTDESSISWSNLWQRVLGLAKLLRDEFDNGRFVPTAVFGISNGGLMVADLLCREVFKGLPVLSLWANRQHPDKKKSPACYYFDNPYNKAVANAIRATNDNPTTFLLVDDIVSTGATIEQARYFLRQEFGEECEVLFTPLFCRNADYLRPLRDMLPFGFRDGKTFRIDEETYVSSLIGDSNYLPYNKVLGRDKRPYGQARRSSTSGTTSSDSGKNVTSTRMSNGTTRMEVEDIGKKAKKESLWAGQDTGGAGGIKGRQSTGRTRAAVRSAPVSGDGMKKVAAGARRRGVRR